jgi:hypothetical protein
MSTSVNDHIRAAVERLFSAEQLFLPLNRRFRDMVSPRGESGNPPGIPLLIVLNFSEIKQLIGARVPESLGDEEAQLKLLKSALEGSAVVSISRTAAGASYIARRQFLRDDEDPAARTIFVKPIHPSATDGEISEFFKPYGIVEKIEREAVMDGGEQRFKTGVSVRFTTLGAAAAAAKEHLTYGVLPTVLGNYFVPKITVMMQATHEQNLREQQAKEEVELRRAQLAKAQQTAAAVQQTNAAAAPIGEIKKFLTPGRTLKCTSVPAGVTWGQLKASLGNLSIDHPALKGQIELVRVDGSTAYIIMKSVDAARELVEAFNLTIGDFMTDIRRVCPSLEAVVGDELKNVTRQYPMWSSRKCEARVNANMKRQRE